MFVPKGPINNKPALVQILDWRWTGYSEPNLTRFTDAWASYQIPKIAGCACVGNAGNVSPRRRFQRKLLVSDPGMHHGTCVTHVPWCMSGSLTCGDGENVPGIPGACAPAILRIWQEAHICGTRRRWVNTRHQYGEVSTRLLQCNAVRFLWQPWKYNYRH